MGNTKMVYFEGRLRADVPPTREAILRETHGTYLALRVETGDYLEPEAEGHYVLGALHSSSLLSPVKALAALLEKGEIVKADLDWTDVRIFIVDRGQVVETAFYDPAECCEGLSPREDS